MPSCHVVSVTDAFCCTFLFNVALICQSRLARPPDHTACKALTLTADWLFIVCWSTCLSCGLTACTPGSAPGPTLGNEYGKPLPLSVSAVHKLTASCCETEALTVVTLLCGAEQLTLVSCWVLRSVRVTDTQATTSLLTLYMTVSRAQAKAPTACTFCTRYSNHARWLCRCVDLSADRRQNTANPDTYLNPNPKPFSPIPTFAEKWQLSQKTATRSRYTANDVHFWGCTGNRLSMACASAVSHWCINWL